MTRTIVVSFAPGQAGPVQAGTPVFAAKHPRVKSKKLVGYVSLPSKNMDDYVLLGLTRAYVPAGEDTFVVIQEGDVHVKLDPHDKIRQHDSVKVVRRNGCFAIVKAGETGPASLVVPGSKAEVGLSALVASIILEAEAAAAAGLRGRPAQDRVLANIRTAMKAKDRLGSRSNALSAAQRQGRNGAKLLIKAIEALQSSHLGKVVAVKNDGAAVIRT